MPGPIQIGTCCSSSSSSLRTLAAFVMRGACRYLTKRDIYEAGGFSSQPSHLARAVLLMAENRGANSSAMWIGDLQIEHILPQTPESGW